MFNDRCSGRSIIIVENCTLECNSFFAPDFQAILRPLVDFILSSRNKLISFKIALLKGMFLVIICYPLVLNQGDFAVFPILSLQKLTYLYLLRDVNLIIT